MVRSYSPDLDSGEGCDAIQCGMGQICVMNEVYCIRAPCPSPLPMCVDPVTLCDVSGAWNLLTCCRAIPRNADVGSAFLNNNKYVRASHKMSFYFPAENFLRRA